MRFHGDIMLEQGKETQPSCKQGDTFDGLASILFKGMLQMKPHYTEKLSTHCSKYIVGQSPT